MMQLINTASIVILFAFAIRTIKNTLYHLFLWQNKEYRLDRMFLHFRTNEGKNLLFGLFSLAKMLLLLVFTVTVVSGVGFIPEATIWLFSSIIVVEALRNLKELYERSLPLPEFSLKIVFVFISTLFLQLIFPLNSSPRLALDYLPFLDKLLGITVAVQIGLFSIPARLKKSFVKSLAKDKAKNLDRLKVIGVTGSYGKTSTKEFIYQLLSGKYKTVKTPENNNTAIGVAQTILKKIDEESEVFIMEAGAYKPGEITEIASLVEGKMQVAVLTGLNPQHLPLFGSNEAIKKAKYELIEALTEGGTAIFNGNNSEVRRLARKARENGIKTVMYGFDKRFFAYAEDIKVEPKKVKFTLSLSNKKRKTYVNLLGGHNLENVLAAASVAYLYDIEIDEIVKRVKTIKPPVNTMVYHRRGNTVLIDDAYNANPHGVKAALEYLKIYDIPKILVLRPLIELGSETDSVHKELGKKAADICNLIILTNKNYYGSFVAGVNRSRKDTKVIVAGGKEAYKHIEENLLGKKVILFEGRDAGRVLDKYL